MHRFVWDLHYPPPAVLQFTYPIAAIYGNTPRMPVGTWVQPGVYTVKLTVNGRSLSQPLTVKMDPRVKTLPAGLAQQFTVSMQLYEGLREDYNALQEARNLRTQLRERRERAGQGALADAIGALDQKTAALAGGAGGGRGGGGAGRSDRTNLASLNGELASVYGILQGADETPTARAEAAAGELRLALTAQLARWRELKTVDVPALNERLRQANLPPVSLEVVK
jgi:hypothetical protein